MADEIRADYDELEQVASRFANQSQAIQQMMQKVRASMDKLIGGDWMGRGVEAFENEMTSEVLPATERLQQALDEASRITNDIVQTVRQAEEEASSRFRVS
ncbi:WXG100 family type VII secretion target [Chloroflexi bacterium TSY]|nr:WXG100 family type VII secretion target [Chloroflexi bacterium TSY]